VGTPVHGCSRHLGTIARDKLSSETANSSAIKSDSMGAHNMKMTEQQRLEYKLYRQECRVSNVEPVRADFLAGEIPDAVIYHMELEQNELEYNRRAMAASA